MTKTNSSSTSGSHLILLFILLLCLGCNRIKNTPTFSYYYWKTNLALTDNEINELETKNIHKLYIRFFDVIKSTIGDSIVALPETPIQISSTRGLENKNIIPVVFIKNDVMLQSVLNIDTLAHQIWQLIDHISQQHNLKITEIQLDCDWSIKSQHRFFQLIERLKNESKYNVGSTIRLHQVKHYNSTGIPPVDTPVLMYYNMGDIQNEWSNYIYDALSAGKYHKSMSTYPKPMHVAIPIYSWVIHRRNGKIINTYTKKQLQELKENSKVLLVNDYFYTVKENHIFWGSYLMKGDVLKLETISTSTMTTIISNIHKYSKPLPKEIILYDLDEINLINNEFETDDIKKMVADW